MYLSIASYVANGNNIVEHDSERRRHRRPTARAAVPEAGLRRSSSEEPFDDYLVQGIGKAPMVMIYEAQFLARAAANDGCDHAGHGALYPEPTIFSKHTFVGLTPAGKRLGDFLTTDPELRSWPPSTVSGRPTPQAFHDVRQRPPAVRAGHDSSTSSSRRATRRSRR